ncbi:ATP-binding protein [Methylophaga sp.]|uniref:ATP-binding protein n=1 Tax=Methylophaga sp. TaxID=2024840 RepID=UPI003F6A3516
MSLKLKVNLFFTMLLLVSLLASTGVLISNARHSVQNEVEDTMNSAARLITLTLADKPLNRDLGINEQMHEMVKALSEIRSLHILLFDSQGLLFQGEPEENIEDEPPEWFVDVLFPKVTPLSKRFGSGRMVIYAAPMQEISERWLDIRSILALGLVIFVFVSVFLYWGVDWFLRPLQRLLQALSGFERGDLHLRLPNFTLAEMNQISHTFNRMGQALELSTVENQRLAMLVRQSGDAILSLDHAGNITFCNSTAERLFAPQTSILKGKALANLGFARDHKQIANILENCESTENKETILLRPDGQEVDLLMSTVPLLDNEHRVMGLICTLRDITELKQAEAARSQLRETRLLAKHMDEVQEAERRHLARELHDELGQCLTAIKTDAVLIRNRTESTEPRVFNSAQAIIDTASHIYDVVHNMITQLRPSPLDDLGLVPTLEQSIASWQSRESGINFQLDVEGTLNNLTEMMNMTVFRVVQEAITNAVRHADASEIKVKVTAEQGSDDDKLFIDIRDNGKGMVVKDFHSDVDFGLLGMRERAQSLGGEFKLESEPDAGVRILISIPLGADKTL